LGQLGYTCDADPELTDSAADRNWVSATGPTLRAALRRAASSHVFERTVQRAALDRLAGELSAARSEAERANLETERAKHEADRANREAERATLEATEMRARMAPFEGLDGFSIRVARAVQAICDRVALWSRFRRPNQPR
jgi:chemotaxis protein histidine kinase CheA